MTGLESVVAMIDGLGLRRLGRGDVGGEVADIIERSGFETRYEERKRWIQGDATRLLPLPYVHRLSQGKGARLA